MASPSPSPSPSPSGDPSTTNGPSLGDLQGSLSQQTQYYPYSVYGGDTPLRSARGGPQFPGADPNNMLSGGQHMAQFWDNWNANPAWRTRLITGFIASGGNPKKAADTNSMMSFWNSLGQASAAAKESGKLMTPWQILSFMAGKNGKQALSQAGSQAQSLVKDTTNTSYSIEDPATALAITQSVLTAALGRQATPDEVNKYKAAIAAYDQAHPTIEHTHTDANGNSTRTINGGVTQGGEQAVIQNTVNNSAEGQAYQTNNVFDQAMKILAGL